MGTSDGTLKIRVDPAVLERWVRQAEAEGESLSAFVREAANLRCAMLATPGLAEFERATRPSLDGETERVVVRSPPLGRLEGAAAGRCQRAGRHRRGVRCGYCGEVG